MNMNNLMKTMKKEQNEYVFVALLAVFVLFNIPVPTFLAEFLDSMIGQVIVYAIALSLFFMHPILGAVALLASYELIRRSQKITGTHYARKYLPSQDKKNRHLTAMNQFPITLEEEMVKKMVPYVNENVNNIDSSYKPVMNNLHNAAML